MYWCTRFRSRYQRLVLYRQVIYIVTWADSEVVVLRAENEVLSGTQSIINRCGCRARQICILTISEFETNCLVFGGVFLPDMEFTGLYRSGELDVSLNLLSGKS